MSKTAGGPLPTVGFYKPTGPPCTGHAGPLSAVPHESCENGRCLQEVTVQVGCPTEGGEEQRVSVRVCKECCVPVTELNPRARGSGRRSRLLTDRRAVGIASCRAGRPRRTCPSHVPGPRLWQWLGSHARLMGRTGAEARTRGLPGKGRESQK